MSYYGPRIAALARQAERDRESFDPETASPEEAKRYLREGAGEAVGLYLQARTGSRMVAFAAPEQLALREAMNTWLECYTRCYGVELVAEFTLGEAAKLLLETGNVYDTAQLLTCVPSQIGDDSSRGDDSEDGTTGRKLSAQ